MRTTTRYVTVLVALLLALAALSPAMAAAQDATPAPEPLADALFPEPVDLPELRITATDTTFEGVPAELAAGRYLITFTNGFTELTEGVGVEFFQRPADFTFEEYVAALADFQADLAADPNATPAPGATAAPESTASELLGTDEGPADYYFTTYQAGGPIAAASGQTVQGIVELPPGDYIVWPDSPFLPLTPVALAVTGELATPAADAIPQADVTVRHVQTADGFAMEFSGELGAGPHMVEFVNESDQPHYFWIERTPGPVTAEQVLEAFGRPEGATPSAELGFDPAELVFVGSTQTQSAGTTQWMALNLEPGTYVVTCYGFDPANEYTLHAFEGELVVLTVGDA